MPTFGKVIGQLQAAVVDAADADQTPDLVPMTGSITFTPNVTRIIETDSIPNPFIMGAVPITAILDTDGYISTPDPVTPTVVAYPGIWLVATDDPSLNPPEFQYSVSYSVMVGNRPVIIPSHLVAVPTGATLDLALVVPPEPVPLISVAAAEAAAALAIAAADSAVKTVNSIAPDGVGNVNVSAGATPDATTVLKGIVKLAGDLGGTADLPTVRVATTSVAGKVELATAAETTTGTDAVRAVTPAGLKVELDKKAPLESPAFTGSPTAPTPPGSDSDTSIATTAFVHDVVGGVAVPRAIVDAKGDLIAAVDSDLVVRVAVGADGQVLTADAASAAGVKWAAAADNRGQYVGINAQTGTTYTPVLADQGKLVTCTNAAAITVTLPSDATVAFPVGAQVDFAVLGAGLVTFVAGAGATANGTPSLVARAQYSVFTAIKVSTDGWLVVGDLAGA